jgi:membrane fusion protein, multidrug efflux system
MSTKEQQTMDTRVRSAFDDVWTGAQDIVPVRWRPAIARWRVLLGALALIAIAALVWALFLRAPAPAPAKVHPVPVTVAKATVQDVPVSITALGAAQAWTSVTVLAQVSGKLLSFDVPEGSEVQAGQVIAEIDPAPYRAVLMQAEGALKRDEALLANARIDLGRYKALQAANAISNQTVDTQEALVKQDEGTVLLDQGTVAAANVNLGWCRIVSPVTGRVGVRLVDPGNLVSSSGSVSSTPTTASATSSTAPSSTGSSSTGIVVVNQIQPVAVTFTVPEGDFQRLSDVSNGFRTPMVTKAFSQETGLLLDTGQLSIADNRVDPTTGSVELKARFPNTAEKLWPGQFVNVQLTLQVLSRVTTIPVTAVNQGPNGPFIYVVGANKTVSMRPVTVAWTQGTTDVVKSGIRAGETVVTDGQMILKAGSPVRIIPAAR